MNLKQTKKKKNLSISGQRDRGLHHWNQDRTRPLFYRL